MKYSIETNRILKSMYKTGSINKNQIPHLELHSLFQDDYITNSNDYHDNNVYLTDKGKAYVEEIRLNNKRYKKEIRRSWIQFWIPLIVSIFALLRPEITLFIEWIIGLFS